MTTYIATMATGGS